MDARIIHFQGGSYRWTPEEGLDPAVVATVENWIWGMARKLTGAGHSAGVSLMDLVQEGRLGAVEAARRFDPDREANFLTWSSFWIRMRIFKALGRGAVHLTWRDRAEKLESGFHPPVYSLDAVIPGTEESWGSRLADPSEPDQPSSRGVLVAIGRLSPRHRELLLLRYGFAGEPLSLDAIGARWGLSRQRVAQIETQAMRCMRLAMSHLALPPKPPKQAKPGPEPKSGPKPMARPSRPSSFAKPGARPMSKSTPCGRQLTVQDAIRDRERQERAKKQQEATARKRLKQAAAGSPMFHLDPAGRLDTRENCPDCEPHGSGLYKGRVCECCGGTGIPFGAVS